MNVLLILPQAENPGGVYERELSAAFPGSSFVCVAHYEQATAPARSAEVLMTFSPFMADRVLQEAPGLRWIQVLGSGVDGIVNLPSLRPEVIVTSGHGVQAAPVSEAALSLMLALSREMPRMIANQAARRWERWPSQLLEGRTLGILGVGQIAESLARKARALGLRVIGVSSGVRELDDFDRIYPREALSEAVREMDYFVVLTPHSPQTHHIVDARVLAAMRPTAFLINVARGGVVNERDLLVALRAGQLRGAALDVFQQEPLPESSELWELPNVLISPHLGGLNTSYPRMVLPLVIENLKHFAAGQYGRMRNVVRR